MQIHSNLLARITEAQSRRWLGEAEGLAASLAGAEQKLSQMDELTARRSGHVRLGMPAFPDVAGRTITSSLTRPADQETP